MTVKYVTAIDVGGTAIKSALLDQDLNIIDSFSVPTPEPEETGNDVIAQIQRIIKAFETEYEVSSVGVSVPGALDEETGIVHWAGNLKWKNLNFRDLLIEKLGKPVAFGHDVRAGGYAEMKLGNAAKYEQAVFIPIGTGIAATLIIDGKIRSVQGFAGEIGHLNVGHELSCVCGLQGCLEAISSAAAMQKSYFLKSGRNLSTRDIVLNQMSEPIAMQVWNEAMFYLARGVAQMITLLAPQAIVFGGGVSESKSILINSLQQELEPMLTFQRRPELLIAKYGINAGTIGTALKAIELLEK